MIKGNLRLFLSNIATAFKGFLGFQTSAASNPFLAITVADDIDPLASAEMRIDLEVEYASDASQFESEQQSFLLKTSVHAENPPLLLRSRQGPQ